MKDPFDKILSVDTLIHLISMTPDCQSKRM